MSAIDWNGQARDILKAVRAVGYLEGMSMWLWQQVGPNLDDEIAVEYDRRVSDIAEYVGLPPREG